MYKKEEALNLLLEQKMLPLYYHESAEISWQVLRALYEAGVKVVEYTNRGANALSNFTELKKKAATELPGLQLGIGTIKTAAQAEAYIAAGADFIVCPTINPAVAQVTHEAGLLWIPGCMTPTEIATAEEAGAGLVKIFPGNLLGPSYITAIKDLFPGLKFMPTGGVEAEEQNLRSWFKAGVVAVGMGSKLITKEVMQTGAYSSLKEATEAVLQLIKNVAEFKN